MSDAPVASASPAAPASPAASAALTIEVRRVYLIKQTQLMVCELKNGCISIGRDKFLINNVLFKLEVLQPVVATAQVAETVEMPPPASQVLVLDVLMGSSNLAGPIATSAPGVNKVNIGASNLGAEMRGNLGTRLREIDNLCRLGVGRDLGVFRDDAKKRWGLNASSLPEGAQLLLRFGPFIPKDGQYVVCLKYWRLLEQLSTGQWIYTPEVTQTPVPAAAPAPSPVPMPSTSKFEEVD